MKIRKFTFNPFQENTYVLYDESGECIIIDPGCTAGTEEKELISFIEKENLKPVRLINTHCHIDHILGNQAIMQRYNLPLEAHKLEVSNVDRAMQMAGIYGFELKNAPHPDVFIDEPERVHFGNTTLQIFFTPGHSAGHIILYDKEGGNVIGGDVLFRESIGRTDLPGGSLPVLIQSITDKMFTLPDVTVVYPGHGPETTIGYEKKHNPFLKSVNV